MQEMLPIAKKYVDYLKFTTTDVKEYDDVLHNYGHKAGSTKVLSVQNPSNGDIFPYKGKKKLTAEVMEDFLMDIINGKVKPWKPESAKTKHDEL